MLWVLHFRYSKPKPSERQILCTPASTSQTGYSFVRSIICASRPEPPILLTMAIFRQPRVRTQPGQWLKKHQMIFGQAIHFQNLNFQNLKDVSHESFVFTFSTVTFLGTSRTKASFSDLPLSLFEGPLAQKLRFQISHCHFLREVSHQSFVFTFDTFTFWGRSRTKASFSHLQLSVFEGGLPRNAFLNVSGCTKCCGLQDKTCLGRWMGKLVRRTVWDGSAYARIMVGSATHWNCEFRRRFADVLARSSIVFCNSVFANRIGMAASRLLGAGAACVILLSFAAGHRKSYWCGCPSLR